jgi:prophage antirepressor-like protein
MCKADTIRESLIFRKSQELLRIRSKHELGSLFTTMSDLKLFEYQHKKVRTATANGQIWFFAKDVCEILEIVNVSDAVSRVNDNMKLTIGVTDSIGRKRPAQFLSESGVYKLAFRSNKPEAERFTDWLASDVIPQIRKTGKYIAKHQGVLPLLAHTSDEVQKDMSKSVNAFNYERGGVDEVMAYNVANCVTHTGKTPAQLKREAKDKGLKSKDRSSGKQVARVTKPAAASCMSVADNLYEQGYNLHRVFEVSKSAEPFFEKVIALGVRPAELED